MVTGRIVLGRDAEGGPGGGKDVGGGGDGQECDRYRLNMWEDNIVKVILGM